MAYYEIFDEFASKKTKNERYEVLKKYNSTTLQRILRAAFHPNIKFFLEKIPEKYKPNIALKPGMSDYTLEQAMNKIYLFEVGNPRSLNLSYQKREQLLVQFLEGMEPREADLFLNILFKTMNVRYLTAALVREWWPSLLPKEDPAPHITLKPLHGTDPPPTT